MRNVKNRIDALEKRLIVEAENTDIREILRQKRLSTMGVVAMILSGQADALRKSLPDWVVDWFIETLKKGPPSSVVSDST